MTNKQFLKQAALIELQRRALVKAAMQKIAGNEQAQPAYTGIQQGAGESLPDYRKRLEAAGPAAVQRQIIESSKQGVPLVDRNRLYEDSRTKMGVPGYAKYLPSVETLDTARRAAKATAIGAGMYGLGGLAAPLAGPLGYAGIISKGLAPAVGGMTMQKALFPNYKPPTFGQAITNYINRHRQ